LKEFKPDVAYLNTGMASHIPAILAARLSRIPVVSHLRGINRLSSLDRLCVLLTQRFITLTRWGLQFYYEQGIPRKKLCQMYNPFDVTEFDRRSVEPVRNVLLEDGALYVIQVGSLREHKRPDLAIEAFKLAKRVVPNLKLILAGSGPLHDALREKVTTERLVESVQLIGQSQCIPALLKRCHIGLSVSRSEGQGHCFLEYMAAGSPVVSWAMPGIGDEIVTNNLHGMILPTPSPKAIADALVALCNSPQLRAAFGEAGRKTMAGRQYDPESHIQRIHETLLGLVRQPQQGTAN